MAAATFGLALAALVQPGAGLAYTPEEQQACTPDAMRLCGEFVPNVDAITACMIQKKAQLSPPCAVFFRRGPERSAGAPTSIAPKAKSSSKTSSKTAKKTKPAKKKTDDG
ncbi:hypothetical protein [Bradyrhizobium manausense]|uniref:hypothetical protein n=1 Tax=Bradyrhizobium manausense TaxID=989370 RepID=UPI0020113487|nr:hypothetical protein [Bradyrhizobium manausense]